LRSGTLTARGFPKGSLQLVPIPPEAWLDATVDWWENSIVVHGTEVHGIVVRCPSPAAPKASPDEPDKPPPRRRRGRSFRELDAPFADKGARMILEGEASGPMDAARALAKHIEGKGAEEAKVKRLALLIRARVEELQIGAGQSGQSDGHSDHLTSD
jgi:hypothetical protein